MLQLSGLHDIFPVEASLKLLLYTQLHLFCRRYCIKYPIACVCFIDDSVPYLGFDARMRIFDLFVLAENDPCHVSETPVGKFFMSGLSNDRQDQSNLQN